jgi:hypothetical protein
MSWILWTSQSRVIEISSSSICRFAFLYTGQLIFPSLSAIFETFGEPWINIYNNPSNYVPKAWADLIAILVKSVVTIFCLTRLEMGLVSFGVGQIAYGASYFCSLLFTSWISFQSLHSFLPAPVPPSSDGTLNPFFNFSMVCMAFNVLDSRIQICTQL